MPTTSERRRLVDNSAAAYEEPLTPTVKRALLALELAAQRSGICRDGFQIASCDEIAAQLCGTIDVIAELIG